MESPKQLSSQNPLHAARRQGPRLGVWCVRDALARAHQRRSSRVAARATECWLGRCYASGGAAERDTPAAAAREHTCGRPALVDRGDGGHRQRADVTSSAEAGARVSGAAKLLGGFLPSPGENRGDDGA